MKKGTFFADDTARRRSFRRRVISRKCTHNFPLTFFETHPYFFTVSTEFHIT